MHNGTFITCYDADKMLLLEVKFHDLTFSNENYDFYFVHMSSRKCRVIIVN